MQGRSIWSFLEDDVAVWKYPEARAQSDSIQNYRAVHCFPDTSWLLGGDV